MELSSTTDYKHDIYTAYGIHISAQPLYSLCYTDLLFVVRAHYILYCTGTEAHPLYITGTPNGWSMLCYRMFWIPDQQYRESLMLLGVQLALEEPGSLAWYVILREPIVTRALSEAPYYASLEYDELLKVVRSYTGSIVVWQAMMVYVDWPMLTNIVEKVQIERLCFQQ